MLEKALNCSVATDDPEELWGEFVIVLMGKHESFILNYNYALLILKRHTIQSIVKFCGLLSERDVDMAWHPLKLVHILGSLYDGTKGWLELIIKYPINSQL